LSVNAYIISNIHVQIVTTSDCFSKKAKPRKLVSLCLGTLGQHLEDIITDISEFAAYFPPHIKVSMNFSFCLVFY
jgi:hypothetical protein